MRFPHRQPPKPEPEPPLDIFAQNIQSVADLVARREARLSRGQRFIERITQSIGRPRFLYINLAFIVLWVTVNSGIYGNSGFDEPPFYWLCTILAMESTLVTGMVLITQNRQGLEAERRAQLDLQINLLSEQKITKILSVLEEIAHRRDLEHKDDPELKAMKETADPEVLLTALEFAMDQATNTTPAAPIPTLTKEKAAEVNDVEGALRMAHEEVLAARAASTDSDPLNGNGVKAMPG